MKRTGSVEADQDSPRGFRAGSKGRSGLPNVPEIGPGRRLSRRAGSMGETIAESGDLWKSTDSRGSNESIASNASIPLPVPVRTRSAHGGGGNESGYSRYERLFKTLDRLSIYIYTYLHNNILNINNYLK